MDYDLDRQRTLNMNLPTRLGPGNLSRLSVELPRGVELIILSFTIASERHYHKSLSPISYLMEREYYPGNQVHYLKSSQSQVERINYWHPPGNYTDSSLKHRM